jgi:chromosome segregation protein
MQADVNQRQQAQIQLQQAVDGARRTLTQAQNKRVECNSRLVQVSERQVSLQREQETQQRALTLAEQESATFLQQVAAAQTQSGEAEQTATTLQGQLSALETDTTHLQQQLAAAEQARQQADRALDRLQTRFDLLRRLREEGAGYASGVRAVLTASRNPRPGQGLTGILGTIASLVQVPAHLDKAIETALGGAFQDVVTQTWEDARQAIEYLKAGGQGRATFLPLDRLHTGQMINAPRLPGILGNAATLVTYDARIEEAVFQLLNRVWVAEDLPAARAALDKTPGNVRPTVVTLGGEIIRPGGAVTGGSDNNRRDDSVLARERELRDLPQQVESARQQAQQASSQCTALAKQLENTRLQSETTKQGLAELARRERQQRQQNEELRRQLDRAQQSVRWQSERLAQTQQELTKLANQAETLRSEQGHLQATETAAATALVSAESAVVAAGANALLQQLADLRAAAAEALGHLRSQQTLQETQRRNWQSVVDQIKSREQRLIALDQEINELSERIQSLTQADSTLQAQLTALREQIEPLEGQATGLAQQQAAEEGHEREAQASLRKDESAWNNAQLQRQRTEDQLHQLRHEIEQDLGLVALESSNEVAYQPPLPWDKYVEQLPVLENIPDTLEEEVRETRARLARASNVNPDAPREYEEAAERYEFLTTQARDLEAAATDLRKVIKELDLLMEVAFERTFKAVAEQFTYFFQKLFKGGTAQLEMTDPNNMTTTGIEITARPPGKRPQSLALLSGGERSLSACALIFAILRISPTPFCVLDEVDAALDEANVDRFRETVEELSEATQFIIITHNRRTLEGANAIYGVTMGNDGVSTVISLRLEGDKMIRKENGTTNQQERVQIEALEELVKL